LLLSGHTYASSPAHRPVAVVAITSGTKDMGGVMDLLWEHLLPAMKAGAHPAGAPMDFADLRREIGFDAYYEAELRYSGARKG